MHLTNLPDFARPNDLAGLANGIAGMALILGIDRFLSMCRALINMIGNAVATLVIARWENELDRSALRYRLLGEIPEK